MGRKTDLKHKAQDYLMSGMQTAFYRIGDDSSLTERQKSAIRSEAEKQFRRVERLFGYDPDSWGID